ncbi:MAG: LysE family translocator [Burkholderiaceae bacterium]|nr:LysE family translocator [Burkholderiaceae bacterium]
MLGIQNYAGFVAAIVVFQLIPGAGKIAILNASARSGVRAGLATVAGTLLGDLLYMLAVVAGLAAVMAANQLLFDALQWFGAAYLCWIGLQLLRSAGGAAAGGVVTGRIWHQAGDQQPMKPTLDCMPRR